MYNLIILSFSSPYSLKQLSNFVSEYSIIFVRKMVSNVKNKYNQKLFQKATQTKCGNPYVKYNKGYTIRGFPKKINAKIMVGFTFKPIPVFLKGDQSSRGTVSNLQA